MYLSSIDVPPNCIAVFWGYLMSYVLFYFLLPLIFFGLPSNFLFLSFQSGSLSWTSVPCIKYLLGVSIWISDRYFKTNYTSELRSFHSMNILSQTHHSLTNTNILSVTQARKLEVIFNSFFYPFFCNPICHPILCFITKTITDSIPSLFPYAIFLVQGFIACLH